MITRILFTSIAALIVSAVIQAEDSFRIYAPSRTVGELIVVDAAPSEGGLTLRIAQRIELGFPAATITAHPSKPLLYVASARTGEKETLGAVVTLNDQGEYASHQKITLQHGYSYLSVDRAGNFLLGANYSDGQVDVYSLDKQGLPNDRVAALDEGRRNAHCVLPSPDNRCVYIPYVKDTNAIYQYRFDADSGKLAALSKKNAMPPDNTGPRHMAYHPKLPIAYFSNEQHLGVSVYNRDESGELSLLQVCDAVKEKTPLEGVSSSDIAITPEGAFLFAGIRGHKRDFDWISRYRILSDGKIELLGLTPADKIPWGLTLSPDGRYLLATAFQDGTLTAYEIGSDGGLRKVASIPWDEKISDLVTVGN